MICTADAGTKRLQRTGRGIQLKGNFVLRKPTLTTCSKNIFCLESLFISSTYTCEKAVVACSKNKFRACLVALVLAKMLIRRNKMADLTKNSDQAL